jgi:hypothetical protein
VAFLNPRQVPTRYRRCLELTLQSVSWTPSPPTPPCAVQSASLAALSALLQQPYIHCRVLRPMAPPVPRVLLSTLTDMSWWWVRAGHMPHQSPPKSPRSLSGPSSLSYTQEYDPSLPILNTVRRKYQHPAAAPSAPKLTASGTHAVVGHKEVRLTEVTHGLAQPTAGHRAEPSTSVRGLPGAAGAAVQPAGAFGRGCRHHHLSAHGAHVAGSAPTGQGTTVLVVHTERTCVVCELVNALQTDDFSSRVSSSSLPLYSPARLFPTCELACPMRTVTQFAADSNVMADWQLRRRSLVPFLPVHGRRRRPVHSAAE